MPNKQEAQPIAHGGEHYKRDAFGKWYIRTMPLQYNQGSKYVWLPISIDRVPIQVRKSVK
jgi:hypothetical protein